LGYHTSTSVKPIAALYWVLDLCSNTHIYWQSKFLL